MEVDSVVSINKPIQDSSSQFSKSLSLQGITYQVNAIGNGSLQQLTIIPSGLSLINDTIKQESEPIVAAEIEDLDKDGFPELLIYTQSAGSGSYGHVIGYSPNKGKSLSQINFPDLAKGSKESIGYMGHDSFSIVESSLARRFPIYVTNDNNAKATGKIRQLQYKLKNGEASKQFVLVGSMEFDQ
ncbi:MAG: hypothetical protein RLY89_185 [Bacteroidota bacterium]